MVQYATDLKYCIDMQLTMMKKIFQNAVVAACAIAAGAAHGATPGGRFSLEFAAHAGIDSNLEARVAADLPRRDAVFAAMRDGRKFLSSTPVSFSLAGEWDAADVAEDAVRLDVRVENAFGLPPLRRESVLETTSSVVTDGVRRVRWRFALEDNPGCGLWRVVAKLRKSGVVACETNAMFEILSDDLNGPCPPQSAKLPVLLASPFEPSPDGTVSGFDPFAWNAASPYLAIGSSTAASGIAARVWEALAANARRWLCRGDETGLGIAGTNAAAATAECLRHAACFQGQDSSRDAGFYDFSRPSCYRGAQLCMLRDYLVERRPPLTLISLAEINLRIGRKGALSREEFEELFTTCWNDFLDFANRRRAALSHEFTSRLLEANPSIARADVQPVSLDRCRSPYSLLFASRIPDEDPRLRSGGSFFMLADRSAGTAGVPHARRLRRAAYFSAGYALNFGQSRLLYPELDCAASSHLAAFRFAYGTQYFNGGEFGCWTDRGFNARNLGSWADPGNFAKVWGMTLRHPPARSARTSYAVVDFDAFKRAGDELGAPSAAAEPVVFNRADEAVGRVWEQCVESGLLPPVLTTLSEIERLMPEATDFVILPPLVDAPPEVLEAIREAHLRGIGFLGLGRVDGLEDLFGVRAFADGPRKFGPGLEGVRASEARYRTDGAEVVATAESRDMGTTPVAFFRKASARVGRLALASIPLGRAEMSALVSRLSPRPAIRTEKGTIMAAHEADGSLVVVVCADTPDFAEGGGELEFSFSVSAFGAARMSVRSAAWHEVVSREGDSVTVRTKAARDAVAVFHFSKASL